MALRLNGSTSGYVELDAPAVAGTSALTLPASSGTIATQAYVDTAEADAIAAGGLQLITTQTFSAVSSVSVNNCFTSTFENYFMNVNVLGSTSDSMNLRMRASGSDETGSNYNTQNMAASITDALLSRTTGQSSFSFSTTRAHYSIFSGVFAAPQKARITNINFSHVDYDSNVVTAVTIRDFAGVLNNSTAYDGFSLIPASGTITGTLRVYGYKD